MSKRKLIFAIVTVVLMSVACVTLLKFRGVPSFSTNNKNGSVEPDQTFVGVLREMNLDDESKKNAQLIDGQLQLVLLNKSDRAKLPKGTTSLFIEDYPDGVRSLLGSCVSLKGKLSKDWINGTQSQRNANSDFTYKGVVITASAIDKIDFSNCEGYTDNSSEMTKGQTSDVYTGQVQRLARVSPDVGPFDYIFVVDTPIESATNPSGLIQKTTWVPLTPANNTVWEAIETNISKNLVIEAYKLSGFAESQYLYVTRVKPPFVPKY